MTSPVLSADALQARWGLTPAEAGVALLLARRGTGSKALARELGVSPTTVRTHLQHALEKTDTHSRAALVSLLLQGPEEARWQSGKETGDRQPSAPWHTNDTTNLTPRWRRAPRHARVR
ncbi:helix-turn-helix transcriptional regulator [Rubellimicrobium rubrum]|uniref:Helix-turn-helix transcriptional regulator n=1 Tax=Rubellimicrobium rubrum TaxID=2585369 RepID=A0A5C4MMN8_9RHOB|nr:helix-turn-helix transcriptional regulator [Rubellimicrobium rubrum]